ncbi:ArsR/SmtB family transcription factor [Ciceribacter azotifigens]|uniref:ArsR/SmtB family transcription factor n=1 Tax=Ciceribacter azotifigens TaxID=2069303 RepID=UPI003A897AB3
MVIALLDDVTDKSRLDDFTSKAAAASELLKALSHESRLLILCILVNGERTVSEIETILGIQQAVVSQHLARLRIEELVKTRREGRQVYYSIANPGLTDLLAVLYRMYCEPERDTRS